jgi:excisionase family DNA binding protein
MEYLTVAETARRLGVSKQRVHQLIELGKLAGEKIPPTTWLVVRSSVEARLAGPVPKGGRPPKAAPEVGRDGLP